MTKKTYELCNYVLVFILHISHFILVSYCFSSSSLETLIQCLAYVSWFSWLWKTPVSPVCTLAAMLLLGLWKNKRIDELITILTYRKTKALHFSKNLQNTTWGFLVFSWTLKTKKTSKHGGENRSWMSKENWQFRKWSPNRISFFSSKEFKTRWWFQLFFWFSPLLWGRFPIWLIFFQMSWNHQPEKS